jgi:hypothetical protein
MRDHGRHRDEEKQRPGAEQRLRQENLQLKKALAKRTLEVDFLKAACAKVAASARPLPALAQWHLGSNPGNAPRIQQLARDAQFSAQLGHIRRQ